jgi:Ca2+/Na+ antiporter
MIKWLESKELFMLAFALLAAKNTIFSASFGDALIFVALCGVYGYRMYLTSKQEVAINDKIKEELAEVKANVSALTIKHSAGKTAPTHRLF